MAEPPREEKPREIRLVPTPFFGSRLHRQNSVIAPTQLGSLSKDVFEGPLPNDAKGSLPVDVRCSTTLLLKLPTASYAG